MSSKTWILKFLNHQSKAYGQDADRVDKDLDIEVSELDMLPHKDEVLSQIDTSSYSEDVQLLVKQWMADLLPLLQSELNLKRDDYHELWNCA